MLSVQAVRLSFIQPNLIGALSNARLYVTRRGGAFRFGLSLSSASAGDLENSHVDRKRYSMDAVYCPELPHSHAQPLLNINLVNAGAFCDVRGGQAGREQPEGFAFFLG